MNSIHFISGLPRAGSTLLASILNQNPNFHAIISNPLARFVRAVVTESYASPGYDKQCPESLRLELIRNLVHTYHSTPGVHFNTNRGWTGMLPLLSESFPQSKVICCVRDINSILNSFETLFRNNPFTMSKLYGDHERETVYTRCDALMTPGHTVRFAYDSLKEAITGPHQTMLFLLEYDYLVKNPRNAMQALYNFIGEPYYEHDFDHVESNYDEFDRETGIYGLHKIRSRVEYAPPPVILPPDIQDTYSKLEVWRGGK